MDALQQGIITLIRSGLTGEKLTLPDGFDLEAAYPQLVRHQVHPLCYVGAVNCGVDKKLPVMQKLFQGYLKCLMHSEGQMKAVEGICTAFEEAGVDYMPLKGCNLKKLYPKPEMRVMGDADILIRDAQYEQIKPLMSELGFEEKEAGPYDYTWDSASLHTELHYRLASPADVDFLRYFEDGWKRAKPIANGSRRFEFSKEDQLIYLFMHLAKHYRDSGVGLKHVTDIWIYQQKNPDLDRQYLQSQLDELGLWIFFGNINRMLNAWFSGQEMDEKSSYITDVIFRSGAFGLRETFLISTATRAAKFTGSSKTAKSWQVVRLIFPAYETLAIQYAGLKKCPFLLPVYWIARWLRVLFFRREKIKIQRDALKIATPDKIETYQQALNYVGLDFNFEE